MKKILKPLFGILILVALLILPFFVFAQEDNTDIDTESSFEDSGPSSPLNKLEEIGVGAGYKSDNTLPSVAGSVVNVALSLLGIIFVVLIIVGGFKWMTAGGNEENVKDATKYIINAVIGLIVTLSSYAIWEFILKRLL